MAINYRFVVKRDTAVNFTAANTLLLSGEFGLETDTRNLKIGDGVTPWTSLPYIPTGSGTSGRGYGSLRMKAASQYRFLSDNGGSIATIALVSNRVHFQPFAVERSVVISTIGAAVSTAGTAGTKFRIGIYSHDASGANGQPGALLAQTADMAGTAIAEVTAALSLTLEPGVIYWVAIVSSSGLSFRCIANTNFDPGWMGRPTSASNSPSNHVYDNVTAGWSAMPSAFSGPYVARSANVPAIWVNE